MHHSRKPSTVHHAQSTMAPKGHGPPLTDGSRPTADRSSDARGLPTEGTESLTTAHCPLSTIMPLELLNLLNLPPDQPIDGRLLAWAEAFQTWIAERRARFTPNVAADSYTAWREFLAFTGKPPWQAAVADVQAYLATLKKRKLRPGTIRIRLAGLAMFYDYCQANNIDAQCEADFNPAAGVHVPKSPPYSTANYLSPREEAALLQALRRDPSPMGKRDYALILMLLRTGWKARDVRELRWGDLSRGAGVQGCRGEGQQGKGAKGDLTEEVWQAVRESLQATGRWEQIQPEEYIFAPSQEALVREAGERPEDWDASRPLSHRQLHRLLKQNAARAGLKSGKINCHTLRHTATMRGVAAGESAAAVGAMLGMQQPRHVKDYLRRLAHRPKGRLRARKRLDPDTGELVAPGSDEIPSRAPFRAGPRNHLSLTHGFYARYLPEFEWLAEEGKEPPPGMDRAILRWRIIMRRITIIGRDVEDLQDALYYLRLVGYCSVRLVKSIKFQQEMRELQMKLRWDAFFRERRKR